MQILPTKILVTGAQGLLGSNLCARLRGHYETLGLVRSFRPEAAYEGIDYVEGDIADRNTVISLLKKFHPKYIINAAAYTHVDACEHEREQCWKVNAEAVGHLAAGARMIDARIVTVSTDYVFDGKAGPYRESDKPNPLGYYGKSKLASENEVRLSGADYAIARTMVLYGTAPVARPNFVTWLIDMLQQGREVRIVDDQYGNPTLASELAEALIALMRSEHSGVYHISGSEMLSRYDFACQVAEVFGLDAGLISRIKTSELGQAAPRPLRSGFIIEKAVQELGITMSGSREGLLKFRQEMELQQHRLANNL